MGTRPCPQWSSALSGGQPVRQTGQPAPGLLTQDPGNGLENGCWVSGELRPARVQPQGKPGGFFPPGTPLGFWEEEGLRRAGASEHLAVPSIAATHRAWVLEPGGLVLSPGWGLAVIFGPAGSRLV